ncbi:YsnF/AvaK domain-containing protein, partial [uncultured Psychrobacter sp.]|uniref:YsnF/AvaK domain-containing protein n=1 Tax=uncultured Psychrobacter sp. TaxID=259303 RepID=UPI00261D6CCC
KEVLIPAGLARIVGDDVFFDSLTQAQVEAMEVYDHDYQYSYKEQYEKDRQSFVADSIPEAERMEIADHAYNAPNTLELLEERLTVNKDRIVAGLVKVGKHVVTEERNIDVELEEEHANIQRTNVDRPTDRRIGDIDGNQTVEVELEAERARVNKETYVSEEVNVGKTTERHTETIAETIQREELDIDGDGNVVDRDGNLFDRDDITAEDVRRARGM